MDLVDKNIFKEKYFKTCKFVELLSFCGKLQDLMLLALVKYFEANKVLCSKYFYTVFLKLQKNGNRYNLDKVNIDYLDNIDGITQKDIDMALSGYSSIDDSPGAKYNFTNPYFSSFYDIIMDYSDALIYSYLFLPIIVDYSIDANLVHQCALIVDYERRLFIFYEPYGLYRKYDAEYKSAILDFLNLYKWPNTFYVAGKLRYYTWHEYFELERGIQSILLEKHNSLNNSFENELATFLNRLMIEFPEQYKTLKNKIEAKKDMPVHKDDKTFNTLILTEHFKHTKFSPDFELSAFYLYYKYNSKTCVTITIVELYVFFTKFKDMSHNQQKIELVNFYKEFESKMNEKLFTLALEFIEACCSSKLLDILELDFMDICGEIKKYS